MKIFWWFYWLLLAIVDRKIRWRILAITERQVEVLERSAKGSAA